MSKALKILRRNQQNLNEGEDFKQDGSSYLFRPNSAEEIMVAHDVIYQTCGLLSCEAYRLVHEPHLVSGRDSFDSVAQV